MIKITLIYSCLYFLSTLSIYGQDPSAPENIHQCFLHLNKVVSDVDKARIKSMSDTMLIEWYRNETIKEDISINCLSIFPPFRKWSLYLNFKLLEEFKKKKIDDTCQFKLVILILYQYYLNNNIDNQNVLLNKAIDLVLHDINTRRKLIREQVREQNMLLDSILPHSLEEAFILMDKEIPKSQKEHLKKYSRDNLIDFHHSFGAWIRNRFNLWGYSPLKNYIVKIEGYENPEYIHPDRASEIILYFYHDWLNGKHERWQKWEQEKDPMKRNQLLWGERDKE